MATYNELKQRINELKARTGKHSISPVETFELMDELLEKTKAVDMTSQPLVVVKSYNTLALANADKNPVNPATNKPLTLGQLVSVVNDGANNAVYRLASLAADGTPTWEFQAVLGDMSEYAKSGGSEKTLKDVDNEIVQLADNLECKFLEEKPLTSNHIDKSRNILGVLDASGLVVVNNAWQTTDFIPWDENIKYFIGRKREDGNLQSIKVYSLQYDENFNQIGERVLSSSFSKLEAASYIRLSYTVSEGNCSLTTSPVAQNKFEEYQGFVEGVSSRKLIFNSKNKSQIEYTPGKNMLALAEFLPNTYIVKGTTGLVIRATASVSCFRIPVKPGAIYTRNKKGLYSDDYNIAGFFVDETTMCSTQYSEGLTFTTPDDCNYVIINGVQESGLQLEEGGASTDYESPYINCFSPSGAPLLPKYKTSSGKNIFDKATMIVAGKLVNYSTKAIVNSTVGSIAIIPVTAGTRYVRNVYLSNVAEVYQGILELTEYNYETGEYTAAGSYNINTFQITSGVKYIAVSIKNGSSSIADTLQIETGRESTEYQEYQKRAITEEYFKPYMTEDFEESIIKLIKNNIIEIDMTTDVKEIKNLPSNYGILLDDSNFRVYSPIRSVVGGVDMYPQIAALGGNVAVYMFNAYTIEISESGIEGLSKINNITNKNRISLSPSILPNATDVTLQSVHVLPYKRGAKNDCRVILITRSGQIFHNKPNRSANGTDIPLDGDHLLFEESVVWDMPHRRLPSKTQDTFPYRLNPCIPEFTNHHPVLNTDSSFEDTYGNGGFGISKTIAGALRPRFYLPKQATVNTNPYRTMGGVVINNGKIYIGTYNPSGEVDSNTITRLCVFSSTDGREFINEYEFISDVPTSYPLDTTNLPNYVSGTLQIKDRVINFPYSGNPSPDSLFKDIAPVTISSISKASECIITTEKPHGLDSIGFLTINVVGGKSAPSGYEWMINNAGINDYGNYVFFGYKKLSDTTFSIHEYAGCDNNNLQAHHIHCLNPCKDGIIIGTGEEYYTRGTAGSTLFGKYPQSHFVHFAKSSKIATLLNSNENGMMRPLGAVLTSDDILYIGSDSDIAGKTVDTATGSLYRGATGLFKGKLSEINDRSKFVTVLDAPSVCYFFQRINGVFIFIGVDGFIGLSVDGENWSTTTLNNTFYKYGGVDALNRICVHGLIIYRK